jgi:hypothetical protein
VKDRAGAFSPRAGRKLPVRSAAIAVATAKVPASTKKGSENATASRNPPRGGPTNEFMSISAPHRRPLALSRLSFATTAGIRVWAELSRRTSAMPNRVAEM